MEILSATSADSAVHASRLGTLHLAPEYEESRGGKWPSPAEWKWIKSCGICDIMSVTKLASCHCGSVRLEVTLSDGLNSARRCDCSFCRMRGAVAVSAPLDGIRFLQGEEKLTLYQFGTNTAKHYFCSVCGIYTHHQRRSNPNEFGVNAACLEGVSPFDFAEVNVMDGKNHPADGLSQRGAVVGTLRFEKR